MEFIFLGTSAGKPTKERNVSSIALRIEQSGEWLLFDCGEATQHRIMESDIHFGKIEKIFITHLHGDHLFGLFGLLSTRNMLDIHSPLEIYAPKGIKKLLKTISVISQWNLQEEIKIVEIEDKDKFIFPDFEIETIALKHSIESYAFYIKEKEKVKIDEEKLKKENIPPSPIYAKIKNKEKIVLDDKREIDGRDYLIKIPPRSAIIAGDNEDPFLLLEKMKKSDLLIHEATYTKEVFDSLKKKQKHTTAKILAQSAKEANLKNLIATHISARYSLVKKESSHFVGEIEDEISQFYDGNFFVAKDFDKFYLNRDKNLIFYGNLKGC